MNNDLLTLSTTLLDFVTMFTNNCAKGTISPADKRSLYVTLDAIKAQTILINNELDNVGDE